MIDKNLQTIPENELDIQLLCRLLWQGKYCIIGFALLGGLLALLYSFIVEPQWSAWAVTDKPTVTQLGDYYTQRQLLAQLHQQPSDDNSDTSLNVVDQVYNEFLLQLKSYDNRRQFWLNNVYYQQQKSGQAVDAKLLDKLINQVQFTPAASANEPGDGIKLIADSASQANTLLRQYIGYVADKTVKQLDNNLAGYWQATHHLLANQLAQQKAQANSDYQQKIKQLEQAITLAKQNHLRSSDKNSNLALTGDSLFLLGEPLLSSQLSALKLNGPSYSSDYAKNQVGLTLLANKPNTAMHFSPYRYLRTPENPAFRDSPRRGLLLTIWSGVGLLIGAGVVLLRRKAA